MRVKCSRCREWIGEGEAAGCPSCAGRFHLLCLAQAAAALPINKGLAWDWEMLSGATSDVQQ